MLHLLFDGSIGLGAVDGLHLRLEVVEVFTQTTGCLALSLCLAYLADGVFYSTVCLAKQFLSLFLGSAKDSLALFLYLLN